jgi:hypothetical protein
MHCASTTGGDAAAKFGPCQVQFVAQDPQQGHGRIGFGAAVFTVDVQLHKDSPRMEVSILVQTSIQVCGLLN